MIRLVLIVVLWVCTVEGQSRFSLLSSLLSARPRSPLPAFNPVLQPPPPPPSHRLALPPRSPHSPYSLDNVGLSTPPKPPQVFSASPSLKDLSIHFQPSVKTFDNSQAAFVEDRSVEERDVELQQTLDSNSATSIPFQSSPTTIKFTLDDVPKFWQPQLLPPQLDIKSTEESYNEDKSLSRLSADSFENTPVDDLVFSPSVNYEQTPDHLVILASTDINQVPTSSQTSPFLAVTGRQGSLRDISLPVLDAVDDSFRPSLSFPFLEDSTEEPQNSVTLIEARTPVVNSFLHSEPLPHVEPKSSIFSINPVPIDFKDTGDDIFLGKSLNNRHLSKTPVPKVVNFSEEKDSAETITKTEKPLPTRKTFHFDQEFLALLKNYNPTEKGDTNTNTESSSEANPFWLSGQSDDDKLGGVWRLKGGARSPAISLARQDTLPLQNPLQNLGGVFTTSLRGLTTTAKSITSTTTPSGGAGGLRIISVGEVGEVSHDSQEKEISSAVPLSAVLKHGVQSLNVSVWVSGCPKLYGKVVLNCEIHHDSLANTAMTLKWKKKSFSEGRLEEQVVAEDDTLKLEDSRFSLQRRRSHYDLIIKDFRPKDCGTYECEARAADTVAASQLLLFTCL